MGSIHQTISVAQSLIVIVGLRPPKEGGPPCCSSTCLELAFGILRAFSLLYGFEIPHNVPMNVSQCQCMAPPQAQRGRVAAQRLAHIVWLCLDQALFVGRVIGVNGPYTFICCPCLHVLDDFDWCRRMAVRNAGASFQRIMLEACVL